MPTFNILGLTELFPFKVPAGVSEIHFLKQKTLKGFLQSPPPEQVRKKINPKSSIQMIEGGSNGESH
jgi:hypothetical protein